MTTTKKAILEKWLLRVEELAVLKEDWDGYGGLPPSALSIFYTRKLLISLPFELVEKLDPEYIDPCNHGTVSLLWRSEKGDLSVEIGKTEATSYLKLGNKMVHFVEKMNPSKRAFYNVVSSYGERLFLEKYPSWMSSKVVERKLSQEERSTIDVQKVELFQKRQSTEAQIKIATSILIGRKTKNH